MDNLIIIGNGFDLAHGLKSSYHYFINHIIDSHFEDNKKYNTLIRLNKNIKTKNELKEYAKNTPLHLMRIFPNKFFGLLISHYSLNNWCDIEKLYYSVLLEDERYSNIEEFHKDFEKVKIHLSEYLIGLKIESIKSKEYSHLFFKLFNQNSLILNFNYTNTLKNYIDFSKARPNSIINIHGELNNEFNPIIFGFAANDDESRELVNKDDKEYMRYIKKHCYKRTNNEDHLKSYLENHNNINVFILGHSCGISDKLILNQIFNHKNIDSIRVFYFEEYERYFETQVNIDRIMNNDLNFQKLNTFQSSVKMPQINDDDIKNDIFINYINSIVTNNIVSFTIEPSVH